MRALRNKLEETSSSRIVKMRGGGEGRGRGEGIE